MDKQNYQTDETEQEMKWNIFGALRHRTGNLNGKMVWLLVGFALMLCFGVVTNAGLSGFNEYIDPPSFLFISFLTLLALVFTGLGKHFCKGIRLAFSKKINGVSRMELQKAISAIKFTKNIVFLEAGLMVTICFVDMLYRMDSPATIGPALSYSGLSFFYALIFASFLACVQGRLDGFLISYMEEPVGEDAQNENQTIYFKLRAIGLTDREAEVARLVSCDLTNKEIGQMLYISDTTVKKHITHILDKTRLEDREKLSGMIKGL